MAATPERDAIVAAALRDLDPDRFAATLMLPPPVRASVQALYAFSADVAAVRERVREPAPGEIRMQWWVDALEGAGHGDVRRNPVADALLDTLGAARLPRGPLVRLLAARRFDLYQDPMTDVGQFEGYAGETVSVLYQYAAMLVAGVTDLPAAADPAGHLGVADALNGHIRAFGYNATRGQIFLPLSVFAAHGVSEDDIFGGADTPGVRAALGQLVDLGRDHASKARHALGALDPQVRRVFAPLGLVEADLKRAQSRPAAPFSVPKPRNPLARLARLSTFALRT